MSCQLQARLVHLTSSFPRGDEILGYRSGLTTRSALQDLRTQAFEMFNDFVFDITRRSSGSISFRLASDIAVKATVGCMSPIYDKINPDALGQDLRDLNVAMEYCKRLSGRSKNLRPDAIMKLVHGYPSHDFVIDYDEAKVIFLAVSRTTPSLRALIQSRTSDMMTPRSGTPLVEMLGNPLPASVVTQSTRSESEEHNEEDRQDKADGGGERPPA